MTRAQREQIEQKLAASSSAVTRLIESHSPEQLARRPRPWLRMKTTARFQPVNVGPIAEVLPEFVKQQDAIVRALRSTEGLELVDGQIRMSPGGARHGQVGVRLSAVLHAFASERSLGHVFESSTGFRLPGGNVRSPDVSFVGSGRFDNELVPEGFPDVAPDLAVEVLSPGDSPRHVLDEVGEYLQAGVRLVWMIDPKRQRAVVYRSLTDVRELRPEDALDGEDVVPGFSVSLAELLK